jgi:hypothetical protein
VPDDLQFVAASIGLLGTEPSYEMMMGCADPINPQRFFLGVFPATPSHMRLRLGRKLV